MIKNNIRLFLIAAFCLIMTACSEKKTEFRQDTGKIFHTTYNIKYEYDRPLTKEILDELNKFDNSLNPFNAESIISKVNRNEPVVLDSFFTDVFNRAQEVSVVSDGAFDITCSPLVNAWGFGFKNIEKVTPGIIDSIRQFVGHEKIRIEDGKIIKTDSRVQINTSAIAKGYSVDVVARLFDSLGIKNYMCEIGGEIVAKGLNPQDECWHIGIDKAIDEKMPDERQLQTILKICDKAVATSGNYRNFYIKDGKKYAHTIDPKTGYPSAGNILGTTVVANDCMTADAYATVFMLTSIEESKRIAKEQGLDIYLIYRDENNESAVTYSEGFEQYFVSGR